MNRRKTVKTTVYWIATIFGPGSFVIGGTLGILHGSQMLTELQHLGYPEYFATILGVWKLLGAVAVVVPGLPRVKEWAYAGFFFNLTAAAASHAAVGDSLSDIVPPLVFLALVAVSWALRPANRSLLVSGHRVVVAAPPAPHVLAPAAAR
jgi:uncharacterized membrane protein YphA (DoxX/SURF4 family)